MFKKRGCFYRNFKSTFVSNICFLSIQQHLQEKHIIDIICFSLTVTVSKIVTKHLRKTGSNINNSRKIIIAKAFYYRQEQKSSQIKTNLIELGQNLLKFRKNEDDFYI